MSLDAYQQALKIGESPRQTEYRIFAQVTTELIEARDQGLAGTALVSALHRNRELWATLAADCGTPGNGLPGPIRANIISLSLWINRHSTAIVTGDAALDDLISVNRTIMEGLLSPVATNP